MIKTDKNFIEFGFDPFKFIEDGLKIVADKFDTTTNSFNLNNKSVVDGLNNNAKLLNEIIIDVGNLNFTSAFDKLGNLGGDISGLIAENILKPVLDDLKDNKVAKAIGIDVGIKDLAICSNGTTYKNINKTKKIKKLEKKMRILQRKASNKYLKNKKRQKWIKL
jgi:transposase